MGPEACRLDKFVDTALLNTDTALHSCSSLQMCLHALSYSIAEQLILGAWTAVRCTVLLWVHLARKAGAVFTLGEPVQLACQPRPLGQG